MVLLAMASNGIPPPAPGAATVPPDYMENGRLYHGYHRGAYMLPCDEDEKDRLDIYHKFFSVARKEQLHSAPFTPNYDGPRILDLGCGTGIWAIDMADTYTQAEVLGVDLSLIQPAHIPENLRFSRRDIESPWHGIGEGSWDMIHIRMLAGSIADWRDLYWKVFRHLKPNFGWMEQVEIDFTPRCDDGSLPANSPLYAWGQYLAQATARAEKPMAVDPNTRTILQQLGFVDVSEQVIRVPMNPWPTEPHQKDIGRWYNLGLVQGLEALSLAPLTRVNHWSKDDVDRLITEVKKDICTKKFHVYCNMHIWTARRPN